jgi:hypothetical protein
MKNRVEFVSYGGDYPCLCVGTLVLAIDGELVSLENCLSSGGSVTFDDDWNEEITEGEWSVDVPEEYEHLKDEITSLVNSNVPFGCCGGCI